MNPSSKTGSRRSRQRAKQKEGHQNGSSPGVSKSTTAPTPIKEAPQVVSKTIQSRENISTTKVLTESISKKKNVYTQTDKPRVRNGGNQTKKVMIYSKKSSVDAQTQTEEAGGHVSLSMSSSVRLTVFINTSLSELVRSKSF